MTMAQARKYTRTMPLLDNEQREFLDEHVFQVVEPDEAEEYLALGNETHAQINELAEVGGPQPIDARTGKRIERPIDTLIVRLRSEYTGARLTQLSPGRFAVGGPHHFEVARAMLTDIAQRATEWGDFFRPNYPQRLQHAYSDPVLAEGFNLQHRHANRLLDQAFEQARLGRLTQARPLFWRLADHCRSIDKFREALRSAKSKLDQWPSALPSEEERLRKQIAEAESLAQQGNFEASIKALLDVKRTGQALREEHAVREAFELLKKLELDEEFRAEYASLRAKFLEDRDFIGYPEDAVPRSAEELMTLARKHAEFMKRDKGVRADFDRLMQDVPTGTDPTILDFAERINARLQQARQLAGDRDYVRAREALESAITIGQEAYQYNDTSLQRTAFDKRLNEVVAPARKALGTDFPGAATVLLSIDGTIRAAQIRATQLAFDMANDELDRALQQIKDLRA